MNVWKTTDTQCIDNYRAGAGDLGLDDGLFKKMTRHEWRISGAKTATLKLLRVYLNGKGLKSIPKPIKPIEIIDQSDKPIEEPMLFSEPIDNNAFM